MLEQRTKKFVLIALIFAFLVLITPRNASFNTTKSSDPGVAPVRIVHVTLWQSHHEQLFEQFRKFAEKHSFTIQIRPTKPTGKDFLVQMWMEDIRIVGSDGDPGIFKIGIYNTDEGHPALSTVFDVLIYELKSLIEEIPNTTFIVIK